MSKHKLPHKGCTGSELVRWLDHSEAERLRQSGSHVTYKYREYEITACDHPHSIPTGTYCRIIKVIVAAGLVGLFFIGMIAQWGIA